MDRNEGMPLNDIYRQSRPWWELKEQAGLLAMIPPARQRSLKVLDDYALNSIFGNRQILSLDEADRIFTGDPDFLF